MIIDTDLAEPGEASEIANVLTSYAKKNDDEDSDLVINLYTKTDGVKKFYTAEHKTPNKLKSAIQTELNTLVNNHDGLVRVKRDFNDLFKIPNFGGPGNKNAPVISFSNPSRIINYGTDYGKSPAQSCSKRTVYENGQQKYMVNNRQVTKHEFDNSCTGGRSSIPIGLINFFNVALYTENDKFSIKI